MSSAEQSNGTVEVQLPFRGCTFGFALFYHNEEKIYELCMVDAGSTQILMTIGKFNSVDEVQEEYKHFVDTFASAMRKIEWGL